MQKLTKITAINKNNQSLVNKAIRYLDKYHTFNNARDHISNTIEDTKQYNKLNVKCEKLWDLYEEFLEELPKREQINIEKSEFYLTN